MNPLPTASMWRAFSHMWRNDHRRAALCWTLGDKRRILFSTAGVRRKVSIWRSKKNLAVPFTEHAMPDNDGECPLHNVCDCK